jgi:hypothetical protein
MHADTRCTRADAKLNEDPVLHLSDASLNLFHRVNEDLWRSKAASNGLYSLFELGLGYREVGYEHARRGELMIAHH